MRDTLNFVRSQVSSSSIPQWMTDIEKAEKLAKLTNLIRPYLYEKSACIDCENNKDCGKRIGPRLLAGYMKLGISLSQSVITTLKDKDGGCHQPYQVLHPLLREYLGVEPARKDGNIYYILREVVESLAVSKLTLECLVTTVTSLQRILAFRDALKAEQITLAINLKFSIEE